MPILKTHKLKSRQLKAVWCARINLSCWRPGVQWRWIYEWVARADKLCMGQAGVPRGRGVNSYTSRWLDPTHGTRALSSVMVLVAGGQAGGAAPSAGATVFCCRLLAAATSLAAARSPRHMAARAPLLQLCCPPPASARILAFFEQPCPLQRGFGQQSWLIPNFQPNSATAQDYPRYFQIEKKDSFWRGCLHHPAPVRIPACLPALLPDLPCGLDRNRPKTALVRLKFSASVQCAGESWALELAGERRLLRQDFVWTDLRNNPWVLLAEVSTIQTTTTLVLYQSI